MKSIFSGWLSALVFSRRRAQAASSTSAVAAMLLGVIGIGASGDSQAAPGFARQTGMACVACHSQAFPAINAFGRAFKAGGYTLVGAQPLITGDNLSLPSALNMSLVTKLRYNKTNGNTGVGRDRGEIQWPDEAVFILGGRVSERIGFLAEIGLAGSATEVDVKVNPLTGKGTGSGETNSFFSFKMPFNVAQMGATNFSITPFSTDGLGVGYGFELLNTGAMRSQRPIEARTNFSAAQTLGLSTGEATGMSFVASAPEFFVNYTPWTPGWGGNNFDVGSGFAHYFRGAYMPTIGSWDTGFGFQYFTGKAQPSAGAISTDAWVIDAQALGEVGGMPLSLYASYGVAGAAADSAFNKNPNDATAFAAMAQLGILPSRANVFLAYRVKDNGKATTNKDNALTLGAQYLPAQNVRFELFHVMESGSAVDARADKRDNLTMLQMFSGF